MTATWISVLLITHDDALWQHWRRLGEVGGWMPARGRSLNDLQRWREQGHTMVVLDASLPGLPAWNDAGWADLLRDIRMVVASTRPSDAEAQQALGAGACGYAHAYAPCEALGSILSTVAAGGIWMGRSLLTRMLRSINERLPQAHAGDWAAGLTTREREVASLAALGVSNQEIADNLHITERTVRAHLSAVFEKLGVADRLLLALKVHGIH